MNGEKEKKLLLPCWEWFSVHQSPHDALTACALPTSSEELDMKTSVHITKGRRQRFVSPVVVLRMTGTPGSTAHAQSRFRPLSRTAIGAVRQRNWPLGTVPAGQQHKGVLQHVGSMSVEPSVAVADAFSCYEGVPPVETVPHRSGGPLRVNVASTTALVRTREQLS